MTQYVAYADLGKGPGAPVDPEDHGGADSDAWKYLIEHRVVVPAGDPDAPAPPEGYEVRQVGKGTNAETKVVEADVPKSASLSGADDKSVGTAGSSSSSPSGAQSTSPKSTK